MVTNDYHEYAEYLNALLSRATGGSDVAAAPGSRSSTIEFPEGPAAPGSQEILDWVTSEHHAGVPRIAILVGGPGNGKSQLTAKAVSSFKSLDQDSTRIARRTYDYQMETKRLRLINDATIGLGNPNHPSLSEEISNAIADNLNLIVNVNRGVIFEELYRSKESLGQLVLSWINCGGDQRELLGLEDLRLDNEQFLDFVASTSIKKNSMTIAHIAVCFMDACSILELQPEFRFSDDETGDHFQFEAKEYRIRQLKKRESDFGSQVPAGIVLEQVVSRLNHLLPESLLEAIDDPIAANIETLKGSDIQSHLLTQLRAGEIASARLLTYRELWGAIALAILGDTSGSPEQQVVIPNVNRGLAPAKGRSTSLEAFRNQQELARHRVFQSIFTEDQAAKNVSSRADQPVLRLTRLIDPVRDASPEWAQPVSDAFALFSEDTSPLNDLLQASQRPDATQSATTAFDRELDRLFCAIILIPDIKDNERNEITSWYGRYLTRLYALTLGEVAFKQEIQCWTQTWDRGEFPPALEAGLKALLLPDTRDKDKSLLLPVFASRTIPVTASVNTPTLVRKIERSWKLEPVKQGENLFVCLVDNGETVVTLELDFALIRETLACNKQHVGMTEYVNAISPRLERFRGVMLMPQQDLRAKYWVLDPEGDQQIYES